CYNETLNCFRTKIRHRPHSGQGQKGHISILPSERWRSLSQQCSRRREEADEGSAFAQTRLLTSAATRSWQFFGPTETSRAPGAVRKSCGLENAYKVAAVHVNLPVTALR